MLCLWGTSTRGCLRGASPARQACSNATAPVSGCLAPQLLRRRRRGRASHARHHPPRGGRAVGGPPRRRPARHPEQLPGAAQCTATGMCNAAPLLGCAHGRAVRLGLGPVCACRLGSRVLQLSVTSRPCVMHDPAQSMASLFLLRCESSLRMCAGSQVCSGCTSMPSCVQTLPGWRGDAPRRRPAGAQVSADMAHALHPNYTDRHEPGHKPAFGGGLVLKHNANQRYATNAVSATLFRRGPRTPLSFALLTP